MTSYVLNKFLVHDPFKMFNIFCLFQVKIRFCFYWMNDTLQMSI